MDIFTLYEGYKYYHKWKNEHPDIPAPVKLEYSRHDRHGNLVESHLKFTFNFIDDCKLENSGEIDIIGKKMFHYFEYIERPLPNDKRSIESFGFKAGKGFYLERVLKFMTKYGEAYGGYGKLVDECYENIFLALNKLKKLSRGELKMTKGPLFSYHVLKKHREVIQKICDIYFSRNKFSRLFDE